MNHKTSTSIAMLLAGMRPADLGEWADDREIEGAPPLMVIEIKAPDLPPLAPINLDAVAPSMHEWQRMQKQRRFANRGRR